MKDCLILGWMVLQLSSGHFFHGFLFFIYLVVFMGFDMCREVVPTFSLQ